MQWVMSVMSIKILQVNKQMAYVVVQLDWWGHITDTEVYSCCHSISCNQGVLGRFNSREVCWPRHGALGSPQAEEGEEVSSFFASAVCLSCWFLISWQILHSESVFFFTCVGVLGACVLFYVPLHLQWWKTWQTCRLCIIFFICHNIYCGGICYSVNTYVGLLDLYVSDPLQRSDPWMYFFLAPFSILPLSYYFISCCMITLIPFLATRRGQWLANSPASAQWGWTGPSGWQGNSSALWPPWGNLRTAQTPPCTWYVPTAPTDCDFVMWHSSAAQKITAKNKA